MKIINRLFISITFTALSIATASAASGIAKPVKIDLPPSANLNYAVRAEQSGLSLGGTTTIKWQTADGKFSIATETRASLLGKIIEGKTEGSIDKYGLAPLSSSEKRFRKDTTTATFDRDADLIRFDASDETYPIHGGEQDRNSAIWQLIALARATPAKFKPESKWHMFVVGPRDADPWTFEVIDTEDIQTPMGNLKTVHLLKAPLPDKKEQRIEIWLAPSLEWYPVQLRYTEPSGDLIEQKLTSISHGDQTPSPTSP